MQQNIQGELNFSATPAGETREAGREETESRLTTHAPERPAGTTRLMEEICDRENLKEALRRVKANKGSPGMDGITVNQLDDYLEQHWQAIREQLLSGAYKPKPVKRVEIPKPDGGVRKLGIPTVLDRFIQQAVMQVLQRQWDPTFSDHSSAFDRDDRRIRLLRRHSGILPKATAGWLISIWRNFSIESIMTN